MAKSNFDGRRRSIKSKKKRKKALLALALATIMGLSGTGIYYLINYVDLPNNISWEEFDDNAKQEEYTNNESHSSNTVIIVDDDTENSNDNQYSYMKTQEAEEVYDLAVSDIAELLDGMDFDNDIQYFYAFYLYYNDGKFSETNDIQYNKNSEYIDDDKALGFDSIIDKDGNGIVNSVCRHKDTLFNDVLNKSNMGFEAYSTTCHLDDGTNTEIDKSNHQISVVRFDGDTRYYDISNGAIADNHNNGNLIVTTNNGSLSYKLIPEDSLIEKRIITNHNTKSEVDRIKSLVNIDNATITDEEINAQYKLAYYKMMMHEDLVSEFDSKYYDDVISKLPNIRAK